LSTKTFIIIDILVAHEAMVTKTKVLHAGLSPHNLIIHEGKGYIVDFDHTKLLENNIAGSMHGTVS